MQIISNKEFNDLGLSDDDIDRHYDPSNDPDDLLPPDLSEEKFEQLTTEVVQEVYQAHFQNFNRIVDLVSKTNFTSISENSLSEFRDVLGVEDSNEIFSAISSSKIVGILPETLALVNLHNKEKAMAFAVISAFNKMTKDMVKNHEKVLTSLSNSHFTAMHKSFEDNVKMLQTNAQAQVDKLRNEFGQSIKLIENQTSKLKKTIEEGEKFAGQIALAEGKAITSFRNTVKVYLEENMNSLAKKSGIAIGGELAKAKIADSKLKMFMLSVSGLCLFATGLILGIKVFH
jgi:predicted YcjX-like family ATPase